MSDRVLYFPYINVPDNDWSRRMFLYWDGVGAIVPQDYRELNPRMRSLIDAQLVTEVSPAKHLLRIDGFSNAFLEPLEQDKFVRSIRGTPLDQMDTMRIHMEKLADIGPELCDLGLARQERDPWFEVEAYTAHQFMAYLALVLSDVADGGYTPATDQVDYLAALTVKPEPKSARPTLRNDLRSRVLDDLLPSPRPDVEPQELAEFKDNHKKQLKRFRREIETEVQGLSSIDDKEDLEAELGRARDRLQERKTDLESEMNKSFLSDVRSAAVYWIPGVGGGSVAQAAVGASEESLAIQALVALIGPMAPLWGARRLRRKRASRDPLAYAVVAQGLSD